MINTAIKTFDKINWDISPYEDFTATEIQAWGSKCVSNSGDSGIRIVSGDEESLERRRKEVKRLKEELDAMNAEREERRKKEALEQKRLEVDRIIRNGKATVVI